MNLFLGLGLLALVALVLYARWVSPARVLRSLGARVLDQGTVLKNVRSRMREVAYRHRRPMPILWVLPEFTPNALVLRPRRRRLHVALTEGLLRSLTSEELDTALSLCLTHGYQRGRCRQTWGALLFFPVSRILQSYPLPAQLLLTPFFSFLLRLVMSSGRCVKADQEAAGQQNSLLVAAVLQKLSVMGTKIPLRNWSLALDSLFLVSPLVLDQGPLWVFLGQPSVGQRRSRLLSGLACENPASLT